MTIDRTSLLAVLFTFAAAHGALQELQRDPEGRGVSLEIGQLWQKQLSGGEVDMGFHAKRLGGTVLRILLQTRLGALCAASLAAGCSGLVTLATKAVFLGQLSPSESSQLSERFLRHALMKLPMLLLLASSSPRYGDIMQATVAGQAGERGSLACCFGSSLWLAWTAVMCWFSMFIRLASLRGDALLCSPASGSPASHARILALLMGILAQDCSWIASYCRTLGDGSASHALLWLFDAVHVALDAAFCLCKYATHAVDHWRAAQAEAHGEEAEHWEGQSTLIYYIDLLASLSLEALTLLHSLHVWWLHGVQMQLADGALLLEVRYMLGTLQQRLAGHSRYRRLQRTLTHSFPEAAAERLAGETCPICLDRMRARLAAAQAAAQAAAAPPSRGPSRPRRRIDNIMD
ncbi:hypothetical protein COHA_004123 [Chlorella ohadii]|uniref:E3 ubiquitin-protein ligase synoviolin-like TPR repeats domain-containing protein n=1 Tax=Chlorella ohadii TaxID=2649997 RepID=A0AAD5H6P9_9CHLO|nr:hypothetical protein COHA_004123 [Chlorella ohadii]